MILYLEDWAKYPNAIVDTETKNKTFVRLADLYRKMGIKNYFFHLALIQPELQGVDPYDPNLDHVTMTKIILECEINPWYFFREVFRLPTSGQVIGNPLRANRGNIGTYWLFFNHIDVALVQPRQTGKSVGADGINLYVTHIAGRSTMFSLITKDHDLRTKNVQRLKDMRDQLPHYLNPYLKGKDSDNPFGLSITMHKNSVSTGVAQNSEAAALNLGRGSTSPCNQIDEGPFCKYIQVTLPAFLSSGNAARDNAAANKSFYGNIFTTTAGKLDTVEGAYMYDLFSNGMMFDERKLYDCNNARELNQVINAHLKGDKQIVYISLSHRQLGYPDEWLYKKMADSNSKGDDANRDYMNIWTAGSLRNPLSQHILEAMKKSQQLQSDYMEMTDQFYCIDWYIPKEQIEERLKNSVCVLGNDMSKAVGKDSITMVLTDSETLETIFTVAVNETNTYRFIKWFASMMVKYPTIVVIPEHQQTGITLIDALLEELVAININPFKRIYNTIVDDGLHLTKEEFNFVHRDPYQWPHHVNLDKYKAKFGYTTSGSGKHSRQSLYKTITRLGDLSATTIKDPRLIKEIGGLVIKNDRIDHACTGHDDMVIAWLLAGWMLLNSRNLDFYGIYNPLGKAKGLNERQVAEKPLSPWERLEQEEQRQLMDNVNAMIAKLEDTVDIVEVDLLETRIKALSQRITNEKFESKTITDVLTAAREAKSQKITETRELLEDNYNYYGYQNNYDSNVRYVH